MSFADSKTGAVQLVGFGATATSSENIQASA